ncbi:MAG TPA: NosD domain-containing protein [Candidatus Limnocylindrales bacterium]|nr:NosD domain-containing protein [Candidatus Limnocylindrales bacterium]
MSIGGSLRQALPGSPASPAPARERTPFVAALGPVLRVATVVVGSVAILVAGLVPIWGSRLIAPQYPKGLSLWVYGDRSTGDTFEINSLNHYIGMRPIDVTTVPELALWPVVLAVAGVLLAIAAFLPGRLGRLALLGLVLIPIGVVADIQRWLIAYGTELDPGAALRLDPFVPLAIGPSTVWNFTIWTYPGPALAILLGVAFTALLARRVPPPSPAVRLGVAAATLAALAVAIAVLVPRVTPVPLSGVAPPPARPLELERLIADAPAGTTVVVPAGTYRGPFVIDRPVIAEAQGDVLLDGGGRGSVVTIAAPDVTLRGFRVANSGGQVEEAAGILVLADRATLEHNVIERSFTGIAAHGVRDLRLVGNEIRGSGQVTVDAADHVGGGSGAGSTMSPAATSQGSAAPPARHAGHAAPAEVSGPRGQGDGISLWAVRGALLRANRVTAVRDGIYLNYAEEVLLDGNAVQSSRYAVHAMFGRDVVAFGNELGRNLSGIVLMYTENIELGRNVIADHRSAGTGLGIAIKDVRGLRLRENVVVRNRIGLQAEGAVHAAEAPALVTANRFASNDVGVALMATTDLMFGGNVFDANLTQVLALEPGVERRNLWSYRGAGNAWSDYRGFDLGADGLGDVPHRSGGADQVILAAAPALQAYRAAPAYGIIDAAQEVWAAGRAPVVLDPRPLTLDPLPPVVPPAAPDAPAAWLLAGLTMTAVLGGAWTWAAGARPMPWLPGRRRGAGR